MSIEAANQKLKEMRAAGIKPVRKMPAGSVLLKAIHEKCYECYGYEDIPDIANCQATSCPLWAYRPVWKR